MSSESAASEAAIYDGKWVIAISAAGKFLGKLKPDTNSTGYPGDVRLEPVYDIVMMQVQPQQVMRQLMPILLIPVDIGMSLAHDVALIELDSLPDSERQSWFDMVRNVRAGMLQLRAARSGVVLPGR